MICGRGRSQHCLDNRENCGYAVTHEPQQLVAVAETSTGYSHEEHVDGYRIAPSCLDVYVMQAYAAAGWAAPTS